MVFELEKISLASVVIILFYILRSYIFDLQLQKAKSDLLQVEVKTNQFLDLSKTKLTYLLTTINLQKLDSSPVISRIISCVKQRFDRGKIRRAIFLYLSTNYGLKVVTWADMVENHELYNLRWFGSTHSIDAEPLATSEPIPEIIHNLSGSINCHQPFVAELKDVQLLGPTAVCIGSNRSIFTESVLPDWNDAKPGFEGLPLQTLLHREMIQFDAPTLDTVCSFIHPWQKIYGHWLFEGLTRFEGMEYYQNSTGCKPTLLLNANPAKWQIESLNLIGYDLSDFTTWHGQRVKVKRLVIPSFRRRYLWADPSAYKWVRERMLEKLPSQQDKALALSSRVFISRKNAAGRRIANEAEVMHVLSDFGFVSYQTESLDFADTVRLFLQAEVVLGTHGSGLSNIIFSECKPLVIDLYSSWLSGLFFQVASSLGGQYTCLACEPWGENGRYRNGDMWVDVIRLRRLLEEVLPS